MVFRAFLMLILLTNIAAAQERRPGWSLQTYYEDNYCSIMNFTREGFAIGLAIHAEYGVALDILYEDVRDGRYNLAIDIDGRNFSFPAFADQDMISVDLLGNEPRLARFIASFRDGRVLTISGSGLPRARVSLTGSARALESLFECVDDIRRTKSQTTPPPQETIPQNVENYIRRSILIIRNHFSETSRSKLYSYQVLLNIEADGVWNTETENAFRSLMLTHTAIGGTDVGWGIHSKSDVLRFLDWVTEVAFAQATGGEFPD